MLTIRHVEPTGHESIVQAKNLAFEKKSEFVSPSDDAVSFEIESGEFVRLVTGTIYVMNDSGKTVAIYHLRYPTPTVACAETKPVA